MIHLPRRIALIKPCCIGDIVFATPLLSALRRGYPNASIDWIVGSSAFGALRDHPALQHVIDCGPRANPASEIRSLIALVRLLRAGQYDLAVVPDRSPLLGLAVLLTGIPQRAGLDSAGRGITYTLKAPINPIEIRHEADIYLDLARVLGLSTVNCWANLPPSPAAQVEAHAIMQQINPSAKPLIIVHPGGGINAGMAMPIKRWPADHFAALASQVVQRIGGQLAVIGAPSDQDSIRAFQAVLAQPAIDLTQGLALPVIGALAAQSALYIGNDNGVAHVAAASGAKVLMIFGPSDPRRYAPFVPPDRAQVAWRQIELPSRGVSEKSPLDFDWKRDGVSVEEAWQRVQPLLN